ncbi:MAG: S8/S53 family peptidase [Candidatus Sericytochromatia bacterium]|nr:S8/S53 family peptidase [Candidatus Tanganyikabacteria bacterium]
MRRSHRSTPILALLLGACATTPPQAPPTQTVARVSVQPGEKPSKSGLPPVDAALSAGARQQAPVRTGRHLVGWSSPREASAWKEAHPTARVLGTVTFRKTWALVEGLAPAAALLATAERKLSLPVTPRRIATVEPLDSLQWSFKPGYMDVEGAHALWRAQSGRLGRPPVVAVIDTGTETSHPDLDVLSNLDGANSLVDEDDILTTEADPASDHGTACAGLVGSKVNGLGGSGMAPGARILGIRVTDGNGSISDFAILQALKLATRYGQAGEPHPLLADNGAGPVRVVSMSLGGYDPAIIPAYVEAFDVLKDKGIPVFVASGNEAWTDKISAPANQPGALAIGCTMRYLDTEWLAPYSSAGPEMFLTAGGNMVYAPVSLSVRGGGAQWALFNGTSSATPMAAGLAALLTWVLADTYGDLPPRTWVDRLAAHMATTADDLGSPRWDPSYGYGRINARRALETPLAEALPERL